MTFSSQPTNQQNYDQYGDPVFYGQSQFDGQQPRPTRRRKARWGWILGILLLVIIALMVIAEFIARGIVGQIAADQIETALPEGVEANVEASPTGWCVLCELIGGELSGLEISGDNVEFGGAAGDIDLFAESITLQDPSSVGAAEGSLRIGEDELNTLLDEVTADYGFEVDSLDLRDGSFGYQTSVNVFGAEVAIDIEASVRIQSGGRIQILAEELALQAGNQSADIPVDAERFTLQLCVAEHLPEIVEITSVEVVDDALEIGFRSTQGFELVEESFQTLGSCPGA
ncbi:MAG: LmeA family phospholipid-binding protein [Gulosibacter sp.]|uniref:LmeA family phospholipid-binding protein n=1 Tax=Gulosibacter sp. TaxID=2817531 RepID=UPI003F8E04F6